MAVDAMIQSVPSGQGIRMLALLSDRWSANGGIAQYNRDLLGALSEAGCRVHVIALSLGHGSVPAPDSDRQDLPKGVTASVSLSRLRFVMSSMLYALRHRPNVVLCGHVQMLTVAALCIRLSGARLWLQLHGIEAWQAPSWIRRRAAAGAQLVTAVSRFTRREFLRWWQGAPERVRVLPNTVSEAFAAHVEGDSSDRMFPIEGYPVLLTVGRLAAAEQYKGHDRVLKVLPELIRHYPGMIYAIAGDGDDAARLRALAATLKVARHVCFLGQVDGRLLPALYRRADATVMPSTGEGFGIAFLESTASGTPTIGLACGGSNDALLDGRLGACVTEDQLLPAILSALGEQRDGGKLSEHTRRTFGRPNFAAQCRRLLVRSIGTDR